MESQERDKEAEAGRWPGFWESLRRGFTGEDKSPAAMRGRRAGSWIRIVLGAVILFYAYWTLSGWLKVEPVVRQLFATWIVVGAATLIAYLAFAKYQAYLDRLERGLAEARQFAMLVRKCLVAIEFSKMIIELSRGTGIGVWECLSVEPFIELQLANHFLQVTDEEARGDFLLLVVQLEVAKSSWWSRTMLACNERGAGAMSPSDTEDFEKRIEGLRNYLMDSISKVRAHLYNWAPEVIKFQQDYIDSLREEGLFG